MNICCLVCSLAKFISSQTRCTLNLNPQKTHTGTTVRQPGYNRKNSSASTDSLMTAIKQNNLSYTSLVNGVNGNDHQLYSVETSYT